MRPASCQLDVPSALVESTLLALASGLECDECKEALSARVKTILEEWALVKVSLLRSIDVLQPGLNVHHRKRTI